MQCLADVLGRHLKFPFNVKAGVCLTFVLIQIMSQDGYDVFMVGHTSVAVERN